ncbi:hypothetical protein Q5H80_03045 [Vibrio sp. SNU_ST1]|uniref:hypothetical protein n=1 Tax=Vibrio sp. SNU_ST1 TaxID=3064001 RepID=UPI0027295927|nr:hypothetical protein [Vibrio sp. SNU_ST1]WKY58642.1 hypothetical protein Q5H80_03045 [Vibrio sp. SNU_ST1]
MDFEIIDYEEALHAVIIDCLFNSTNWYGTNSHALRKNSLSLDEAFNSFNNNIEELESMGILTRNKP